MKMPESMFDYTQEQASIMQEAPQVAYDVQKHSPIVPNTLQQTPSLTPINYPYQQLVNYPSYPQAAYYQPQLPRPAFYPQIPVVLTQHETPAMWDREFGKQHDTMAWAKEFEKIEKYLASDQRKEQTTEDLIFPDFEKIWATSPQNDHHAPSSLEEYRFETSNQYLERDDPQKLLALARMYKGRGATGSGNLTNAALIFEALLQRADASTVAPKQELWSMLGETQAENEKDAAAIAAFKMALNDNPGNALALMDIAICYTNEGRDLDSLKSLYEWVKVQYPAFQFLGNNDPASMRNSLIHHYQTIQQYIYQNNAQSQAAVDPDLIIGLGLLYYSAGNESRAMALECFQEALKHRPDDPSLLNRIGATLANEHKCDEAIPYYEKALARRPHFVRAMHNLGVAKLNLGRYQEAARHLIEGLVTSNFEKHQVNISTALWDTLKRSFYCMERSELAELCQTRDLSGIIKALE